MTTTYLQMVQGKSVNVDLLVSACECEYMCSGQELGCVNACIFICEHMNRGVCDCM